MYKGRHVKYPLFLPDFNKIRIFRQIFEKKKKYSNIKFLKVCPMTIELLHADGRTDKHDEAILRTHLKSESYVQTIYSAITLCHRTKCTPIYHVMRQAIESHWKHVNVCRWTRSGDWMPQLCGARNHVFLLYGGSDGSEISEIHMVEEVHDLDTTGKIPLSLVWHS
jgi:hypothetical protein